MAAGRCSPWKLVPVAILSSILLALIYTFGGDAIQQIVASHGSIATSNKDNVNGDVEGDDRGGLRGGGNETLKLDSGDHGRQSNYHQHAASNSSALAGDPRLVPAELLGLVYNPSDFVNEDGIAPTYFQCHDGDNTCGPTSTTWGPCYRPQGAVTSWQNNVQTARVRDEPVYNVATGKFKDDDVTGYCRPGFLIIGAGKCGTSSLYHYLVDHPRVLPARQKQIHYFKYYRHRPLKWYYSFFPSTISYMSKGGLMTGEASPGYLPYPDVVESIESLMPGSRIIMLGRNPIERMYSSYKYNYVSPTIALLKRGKLERVQPGLDNAEYAQYLFTFEEMVQAELVQLRKCLDVNSGDAVRKARQHWLHHGWESAYQRRAEAGLPPLVDLDQFCYGPRVNKDVLRNQWKDLVTYNPTKYIPNSNLHLVQAFIGRSLYTFPLEWWYERFDAKDIYFVCTEELRDFSGDSMDRLRRWLGLPFFNFSATLSKGAYNVGGHRGYDTEISWEQIEQGAPSGGVSANKTSRTEVPLSPETREQLETFLRPINERLFELIGKRCDW